MPERAKVRSVDAIDAFRSHLVVYLSQARPALEEISSDVLRTRLWLENDQRMHLERELARRRKQLDEAQQALFSARLGAMRKESPLDQMAVQRAKRAVEDLENKLKVVKRWTRDFDSRVQPLLKQVEKLQTVLTNDMAKGVASLAQTIQSLAAYAEVHATPGQPPVTAVSSSAEPPAASIPGGSGPETK